VEGGEEGLFSCNCYFGRDGAALATFVARKVRQWPPDIGTSASGEECRNDDVLSETLRVFGSVGFHGLAYLEMKLDTRTGRLVIIEPNVGRPTGRSAISEAGGVELVYTAYADAAGLPLPADREQRYIGTKWLDLRRDAQAAIVARGRGELTVREWAASLRGPKAHAIWSRPDPMPFVIDMVQAVATGARLLFARVMHRARTRLAARSPDAKPFVGASP
jgi:predicted ATP-grasp superfamily ATP-dependent carboligase